MAIKNEEYNAFFGLLMNMIAINRPALASTVVSAFTQHHEGIVGTESASNPWVSLGIVSYFLHLFSSLSHHYHASPLLVRLIRSSFLNQ